MADDDTRTPKYVIATFQMGPPWLCDGCDGTVLMGWRSWWPFPDEKPQGLVIDFGEDDRG